MGQYLRNKHDKVPKMGSQTEVAKKLMSSNERDEVPMNPSTDTIVGPTTIAVTFAMKEPAKRPKPVKKNNPLSHSSHITRADSPIRKTQNPIPYQN